MDYKILQAEIINDPLVRGYGSMSAGEAADSLNVVTDTRDRQVIPAHEVFEAIDPNEMRLLADEQKGRLQSLLAMGLINIQGANTRAMLGAMFDAQSATRPNLITLQAESVSRAENLGLPTIREKDIERVRAA